MPPLSYTTLLDVTERNVLALQEAKANGRKVVGQYCIYSPNELALAADAIPVSLCGTKNSSIPKAETELPRTLCPLIKSSYGFALEDSCPYLAASDIVVADATCDGKKKMYELLAKMKPVIVLQLPQNQTYEARVWWRRQYEILKERLEHDFGVTITEEKLEDAMDCMRRQRKALKRVLDLGKRNPSPLTGMDLLTVCFRTSFLPDPDEATRLLNALADELEGSPVQEEKKKPRILLTGVPTGMGSHKVIQILEEAGAAVVCIDNCTCYKKVLIDDSLDNDDLLQTLASRYLAMHCAVMSPNPNRYTVLKNLAAEFSADAVVDLTWQGCQTYEIESFQVKKYVQESLNLPFLEIITDYSSSDTEQIKVRVEAFLEMLTA